MLPSSTGVWLAPNPTPGSATGCARLSSQKHTVTQAHLYMGGTIIPGMAAGWRERRGKREGEEGGGGMKRKKKN